MKKECENCGEFGPCCQKQEPVAWMHKQGNHEEPSSRQLDDWEISNGWTQYPLYTHPQPNHIEQHLKMVEQEPVAWKLESGQAVWFERTDPEAASALPNDVTATPLYTHPQPKREWVGLTDDEVTQQVGDSRVLRDVVLAVEHVLKEKNGGAA